jgi:predicted dehydrogenase/threonine dehydrogenase-like Zn-dependent dehydrogenase
MKQLLQNMRDGKTLVSEVPAPTPLAGQALVRVSASLVSAGTERMLVEFAEKSLIGKARSRPDLLRQVMDKMKRDGVISTLHSAFSRLDQPMALGYSSAGTVVELGAGMDGFKVGQRVACAGGNYAVHAEYNVVPKNLTTPLPDSVDFESAAFTTLGAIALQGFRLAEPQVGERVAVIGLGLLGLLTAQIASAAGCRVFGIDTNPERVKLAGNFGIVACTRESAIEQSLAFTVQRGFDSVIICADTYSSDPVELAGAIARDRAKVVATGAVGLTLPRKVYFEKELSFINSRSYGPGRYDPSYEEHGQDYPIGYVRWTEGRNLEAVVALLADRKINVKPLITHRIPIDQAPSAYEIITGKRKEPFLGVILTYAEQPEAASKRVEFHKLGIQPAEVRLGVIGAGLFANATLLPAIKNVKDVELVGIASAGGLHAQHSGNKFGFAYATSQDDQILNDAHINTVMILTRHDSHAELAIRALTSGKHVFVEKPMALDDNQLEAVSKQLEKSSGQLFMVGFNRRFAPLAVELSHFLADRSEPLHVHYRINAGFIPAKHWVHDPVLGGGRIIGEGCHFVDFISFLVGAVPASVNARALPDIGKYHGDNVSMTFTFPDGSIGVVDYLANGDKAFSKERVEVFCGERVAVLHDFRVLEMVRDGKKRTIKRSQDKGHTAEMQALTNAIRSGGQPPIPYEQLVGVTRATISAVQALRDG